MLSDIAQLMSYPHHHSSDSDSGSNPATSTHTLSTQNKIKKSIP